MVHTLFHMQDIALQAHTLSHNACQPMRMGNHYALIPRFGVFKGPSGYRVMRALQPQWKTVCAAGRPGRAFRAALRRDAHRGATAKREFATSA